MIFKDKKAQVNDTVILLILASVFIALGILAPILQEGFSSSVINHNNVDILQKDKQAAEEQDVYFLGQHIRTDEEWLSGNSTGNPNSITAGTNILTSVIAMFFWSFTLPLWVDVILTVFRLIFWFLVYRAVRSGGG